MQKKHGLVEEKGFTLVELLIVVVIIGILATIAVPTFRKMAQKSRKAEAKVALGALYSAEQAFKAEYSGFGNRLDKIGFELDGSLSDSYKRIYTIGFPTESCNDLGADDIRPLQGRNAGMEINSSFPAYYNDTDDIQTEVGNSEHSQFCLTPDQTLSSWKGVVGSQGVDPDGMRFVATASGCIKSSNPNSCKSSDQMDYWYIDSSRKLSNQQDGIN